MAHTTTYHGSCLCSEIRFEAQGEPIRITRCHCWNCRKQTGCAFSPNIVFPDSAIRITSGADKRQKYRDGAQTTGNALYRHFCGICGSHLFASYRPDTGIPTLLLEESNEAPVRNVAAVFYSALDHRIRRIGTTGEEVKENVEDAPETEFHVKDRLKWVAPLESAVQIWTKP